MQYFRIKSNFFKFLVHTAHSDLNGTWPAWWSYWCEYIFLVIHWKLVRCYLWIQVLYLKIDLFSVSALAFGSFERTIYCSWLWNNFSFDIILWAEININLNFLFLTMYLYFWYALVTGFIILFQLTLVKQCGIEKILLTKYLLFLVFLLFSFCFTRCSFRPIIAAA